jgi:hypothetical protein
MPQIEPADLIMLHQRECRAGHFFHTAQRGLQSLNQRPGKGGFSRPQPAKQRHDITRAQHRPQPRRQRRRCGQIGELHAAFRHSLIFLLLRHSCACAST